MGEKAGNELFQRRSNTHGNKGFCRLARLFVDNYAACRCGGTVRLTSLTGMKGFSHCRDYGRQQSAVVSGKFQQALDRPDLRWPWRNSWRVCGERLITKAEKGEYEAKHLFAGFCPGFTRHAMVALNILEKGPTVLVSTWPMAIGGWGRNWSGC